MFRLCFLLISLFCYGTSFAISGHPYISPSQIDAKNFAFEQLQRAAEAGDPDAQYMVGYGYYYGKGAPQDTHIALNWIKRASVQGQNEAIKAMAVLNRPAPYARQYAQYAPSKRKPVQASLGVKKARKYANINKKCHVRKKNQAH